MSWLPNPFKSYQPPEGEGSANDDGGVAGGGSVKDDLSVIGESIGRQFRGVAAFLAPPPSPPGSVVADDASGDTRSPRLAGVRNDLAEISGSFRSSLSLISSNKAVIELSKLASNFMQNDGKVEEDNSVGITDEVVEFVKEISQWSELWTDFPVSLNVDDFDMSQAQAKHISVIQQLVPTLADLKAKLSSDLSEKQFWCIYFFWVLPLLDENSFNLLSTPELVKARSSLMPVMQNKRKLWLLFSGKDHTDNLSHSDRECGSVVAESSEASGGMQQTETKGTEKNSEDVNTESSDDKRQLGNEEQIFSDLEDDYSDVSTRQYSSAHGKGQDSGTLASSPDGCSDWVRLDQSSENVRRRSRELQPSSQGRDSEGEDWLTIDDFYD